jgi:hypothetical protein
MKLYDLSIYRNRKVVEDLERRVGELALENKLGSVREMKLCFKEWLKANDR